MSLIKQLKQAIEAYGNSHNGTTRNTIKNAIIVLTRRNKQWDEHFLNELIKLNDSSIFEAINVYDFIDYAYAHKKLPHLFKSLKIACRSSFNSFFGVLSLVNKIQVIKQKQEHKSARSSDNKNLSLSEAKLESGCEHILFDDRSGVIYLITETLDKYHETPLTTHEHNLIRQVLTIKDTPTIESQKVLPFLIRALERR